MFRNYDFELGLSNCSIVTQLMSGAFIDFAAWILFKAGWILSNT
jgi:hypothetical protein